MAYSPITISTDAASVVPWETAKPTAVKWVSPTGSNASNGSEAAPYKTIQAAVNAAAPGTAILVKAGTYTENIKLNSSGTTTKPIWLASVDGEGAAKIQAANAGIPVMYGFGTDNLAIKGFQISGGAQGILFTQSGSGLTNLATNLVIEQNNIYGQSIDGIKTAQTLGVAITGNTVHNIAREEGIDNVYMRNSMIAHNEVYDVRGLSAIVTKAGSANIKVVNNDIHHTPDGVLVGGFSSAPGSIFPKGLGYEARNITVEDNRISASKQPVNIYGGVDSTIKENALTSTGTLWNVRVGTDNLGYASKNIDIFDNDLSKLKWLWAAAGSVDDNHGNSMAEPFAAAQLGPDALTVTGVNYHTVLDSILG